MLFPFKKSQSTTAWVSFDKTRTHAVFNSSSMIRFVLTMGVVLLFLNANELMPLWVQACLFIAGVVLVGLPHGAADLLVGLQNAKEEHGVQSQWRFLSGYLATLILFGFLLYLFPTAGILMFFVMAAFHFGETDLNQFETTSFTGKFFVISYGLLIIGFILLLHLEEASPVITSLGADGDVQTLRWLEKHRELFLSVLVILFFSATFIHFLHHPKDAKQGDIFLWRLIALLVLLYNLPLLLGFFFYFVVWHSVFSLSNIIGYLRNAGGVRFRLIVNTIFTYSAISFTGISVLFFFGGLHLNPKTVIIIAFGALAVLTAPHMMVMHEMYRHLRKRFSLNTIT